MKLDGALAFYHSNVGKPHSQSFEFDVNDSYSAGYRTEDHGTKDIVKRVSVDLEANKGNLDPFPSKMDAEDVLDSPKPDSNASVVGLKNENEGKVKDSIRPVSHSPPQDIELLAESPNDPCPGRPRDIGSVESSDLPRVVDSLKNPADVYMDKSVTECEPELVVVYKESSDHVIKDICVDEGIPAEEKILLENTNGEAAYKFLSSEDHKSEKSTKGNAADDAPFPAFIDLPAITKESDKVSTNPFKFDDLMLDDDNETRKFFNDVDKEMLLAGYKVLLQDSDEEQSMPLMEEGNKTEENCSQFSSEPELPSKPNESEDRIEEATSTSSALVAEESNGNAIDACMPENGDITSQFDTPVPAAASAKEESDQVIGEPKLDDARNSSESVDVKPDDHQAIATSHVRGLGETSFSAVGRVSSRITYLDPVAYSGSISLRSDSSTTSTRSFAFPVLQSEWNSSPVRMAKADRRHYRKHRGWRQGLLCCRF